MSPKLCWAEHSFLTGKPKIVSLLRRGCRRRDLTRSTAKYLGGHRTDPEQRGYTEKHYQTLERQWPELSQQGTPLPPGISSCQKCQRNQSVWQGNTPTLAELGSSSTLPRPALSLCQALSSEMAAGRHFSYPLWPKGYLGILMAALLSLQCQTQNRQCHSLQGCCCLHWATPSCCWVSWQSAGRPERLCPCQGNALGQLLTEQHFWAVLTYLPLPGGLTPSPSTSVGSYSCKTS